MLERMKFTQKEQEELLKSLTILVDTREHDGCNKHILDFFDSKKIPWKKLALQTCDYSFFIPANESLGIPRDLYFDRECCIERKANLDEFAGNASRERDRIKKEFAEAPEHKILLIENATYSDMINGNYRSQYSPQSYLGTIMSFWHKYNLPVMFMPDISQSGKFIYAYFYYYLRSILR